VLKIYGTKTSSNVQKVLWCCGELGLAFERDQNIGGPSRNDRTAAYLSDHLPEGYIVVPHYGPRDGAEDEVPMVVIGPPGVVVIEPRDEGGEVLCYEDHWYRKQKHGVGRRFQGQSPSQRARWNASRVRGDISVEPTRTRVEAVVVFTSAHIAAVSSSSVPAFEGLPAIVDGLVGTPREPVRVAV